MNFFTSMLFALEIILFICQIIFLSRILALVIKQPNLLAFLLISQALQITALYSVRTIVTWMYSYKVSQVYLIWKHQKRLLFGTLSCLFGIYLFQIFVDYQLIQQTSDIEAKHYGYFFVSRPLCWVMIMLSATLRTILSIIIISLTLTLLVFRVKDFDLLMTLP